MLLPATGCAQNKSMFVAGQIFGINRNVFIMSICAAFNSVIIGFNIGVFETGGKCICITGRYGSRYV